MYLTSMEDMSMGNEDCYGGFDLGDSMLMNQEQNPPPAPCFGQRPQKSHSQNLTFQLQTSPAVAQSAASERRPKVPTSAESVGKVERGCRPAASEEDARSFNAGGGLVDGRLREKASSQWQRMKWSDQTVKLLIVIVSYLGEEDSSAASYCNIGRKRKLALVQKKGKWKLVSKVMAERGCYVSPQQCEDKFNDLNKRYKRLTDILGPGTSCKVVENPAILDRMNHLSDKAKDDVRKILSSKHLFYEEMCSYHNGNHLHLPDDPSLRQSLQLALRDGENDSRRSSQDDPGDDDDDDDDDDFVADSDDREGGTLKHRLTHLAPDKRKLSSAPNSSNPDQVRNARTRSVQVDMHQKVSENSKYSLLQKQCSAKNRSLRLEEQRLRIEAQMVELEKQRIMWQSLRKKKDRELEQMRIDNERIRLENEHLAWELKRRELEIKLK